MEHSGDKHTGKGSMGMSGALLPYESCSNFQIIDMSQLHYGHCCHCIHMSQSAWEDQVPDKLLQARDL
jgi:hypothetical protein